MACRGGGSANAGSRIKKKRETDNRDPPDTLEDENEYERRTVNRQLFNTWYNRCYHFQSYGKVRD
jgi:hypothetical protein